MLPAIVIASHKRQEITEHLITSLFANQGPVWVILCVSDFNEYNYFKKITNPNFRLVKFPNNPLGAKWQRAVDESRKVNPTSVIILGSDDRINPGFVSNATKYIDQGFNFVGLKRYEVINQGHKYLIDYKPIMPLGGGRVYSAKLLDSIGWKLFVNKEKQLDDYGWERVQKSGTRMLLVKDIYKAGLIITAIKGNWPMMNKFDPNHRNLTIIKKEPCAE